MTDVQRILLALAILLVDFAVFFIPLTAITVTVLMVVNPQLLHRWTSKLVGKNVE